MKASCALHVLIMLTVPPRSMSQEATCESRALGTIAGADISETNVFSFNIFQTQAVKFEVEFYSCAAVDDCLRVMSSDMLSVFAVHDACTECPTCSSDVCTRINVRKILHSDPQYKYELLIV